MQPNHSTAKAHMEIARDINHAKRVMFEAHRKGKPLADAAEEFFAYLRNEFDKVLPDKPEHRVPEFVNDLKAELSETKKTAVAVNPNDERYELDDDDLTDLTKILIHDSGDRCVVALLLIMDQIKRKYSADEAAQVRQVAFAEYCETRSSIMKTFIDDELSLFAEQR